MNFKQVTLTNEFSGEIKTAPVGFSWTTFFFGFIPALFRTDWKWAIIQFILSSITFGISNFVMPFIYNKMHIKDLLNKGFFPTDENQVKFLIGKGIMTQQHVELYNRKKQSA